MPRRTRIVRRGEGGGSVGDVKIQVSYGRPGPTAQPVAEEDGDSPALTFLCDSALHGRIPEPARAVRFAPDWFRRLEREMGLTYADGQAALTAKGCLPMTDAFALGFVIPLPFDVALDVPEDRIAIRMGWAPDVPFRPIEQHHPAQLGAPHPPFDRTMPLKFMNPWRIKVPEGYSLLFTHPLSRPDLPFTCFSGFVDADRFHTTVNVPFAWTGPVGQHHLPAGTPIAQVIPIRRDAMAKRAVVRAATPEELAEQADASARKYGEASTYAREWRVKK